MRGSNLLLSIAVGIGIVLFCDLLRINRENALYLSALSSHALLPISGLVAMVIAWISFVRTTRTASDGGRLFMWRRNEPARWVALGVGNAIVFSGLSLLFSGYALGVLSHYTAHRPFAVDATVLRVWSPARSMRFCSQYAVVSLKDEGTARLCTRRQGGNASVAIPAAALLPGRHVTIQGRLGILGAVADEIVVPSA
jgi:hypothetical protein